MTREQAAKILGMTKAELAQCTEPIHNRTLIVMAKLRKAGIDDEKIAEDLMKFMGEVTCESMDNVDESIAFANKSTSHGLDRLEAKYLA